MVDAHGQEWKDVSIKTFSFKEFDEQGNWTLCEVSCETTKYKLINIEIEDDYEESEKQKNSYQITRQISYYTPDEISALEATWKEGCSSSTELAYRQRIGIMKAIADDNVTQYAMIDLDGDGNEEFFITDNDVWYTSVFTLENGNVKLVNETSGPIECVHGNLLIYSCPTSTWGAIVYCAIDNGKIIEGVKGITMEGEKFYLNDKECTQDEFESFFSKFNGKERYLEWKPLSSLIY